MEDRGFDGFGGFFRNDMILWFIILFLLLFWDRRRFDFDVDPK
jgi:hypothetical protein